MDGMEVFLILGCQNTPTDMGAALVSVVQSRYFEDAVWLREFSFQLSESCSLVIAKQNQEQERSTMFADMIRKATWSDDSEHALRVGLVSATFPLLQNQRHPHLHFNATFDKP